MSLNKNLNLGSHRDTKGCCLDYTYFKMDDKVDIALGYICDKCKNIIISSEGKEYFDYTKKIIRRKWIGNINDFESVAYNLKHLFKFDIKKDSGFDKTFWDKAKDYYPEIPKEVIVLIIGTILGFAISKI